MKNELINNLILIKTGNDDKWSIAKIKISNGKLVISRFPNSETEEIDIKAIRKMKIYKRGKDSSVLIIEYERHISDDEIQIRPITYNAEYIRTVLLRAIGKF